MKNKRLITILSALITVCMFLSSCSSFLGLPSLPDVEYAPSIDTTVESSSDVITSETEETSHSEETTVIYVEEPEITTDTEDTDDILEGEGSFIKDKYASLNGYNSLLCFDNGADMQILYQHLKVLADRIHASEDVNAYALEISDTESIPNILGKAPYPATVSNEELFLTFNLFRADNPQYYWIDNQMIYSSTNVYIMTVDDYADGSARMACTEMIEEEIEVHLDRVKDETNTYRKALGFHDYIIRGMDYTETDDGSIPSELKYHNVWGAFVGKSGVCESYAKAFQLLLNASDIENYYIIGRSGTQIASGIGHVWNMLRLDDGSWYYCDLTWDDLGDEDDGVQHNNFCVGSETNISWGDDGYVYEPATFGEEHIENLPSGEGEDFLYALPTASETAYDDGSPDMLRQVIESKSCVFMISGYDDIVILQIKASGDVELPALGRNGHIYLPSSIVDARLMYDGFGEIEDYTMLANPQITSLRICEYVRFVSDGVLEGPRAPAITVDSNNPYIYYDEASRTIKKK